MATKSDEKLIKAGRALIAKHGIKSMTVRRVCQQAGVHLGTFTYFFKDKDTFLKKVFDALRREIMDFIDFAQVKDCDTLAQLTYSYEKMAMFAYAHANLLRALFVEFLTDEKQLKLYLKKGIIVPFDLPVELINRGQREGVLKKDVSCVQMLDHFFFGGIVPILFAEGVGVLRSDPKRTKYDLNFCLNRMRERIQEMEVKND